MSWYGIDTKNPKHPVTKKELVGGFNPLDVSQRPFGYRETVDTLCCCDRPMGQCLPDCGPA